MINHHKSSGTLLNSQIQARGRFFVPIHELNYSFKHTSHSDYFLQSRQYKDIINRLNGSLEILVCHTDNDIQP